MTQPTYTSGLLFTRAHKAVRSRICELLEAHGLTPSYWFILGITTGSPDGIRLTSVAKQMDVKAPLVTMLSNDLIAKGLISRVPHQTDGRAKLLKATPAGRKLAGNVENELTIEIARLMHGVSAGDAAAFRDTLKAIISNARSM